MPNVIVYPYKKGLNSTARLRDAGCPIRYETSRVRGGVATSWGNSTLPPWWSNTRWINNPQAIPLVSNKLMWVQLDLGPNSTVEKTIAEQWARDGHIVMCRTILNGSGGAGIVVARSAEEVVDAPLYTSYFKKQREYRVVFSHLLGCHYVASKRLRADTELDRDTRLIRTTDTGYVYQVEHDPLPTAVLDELMRASTVLHSHGLNILGYDVAYNTETDTACIIEANSAFGLNDYSAPIVANAMEQLGELV